MHEVNLKESYSAKQLFNVWSMQLPKIKRGEVINQQIYIQQKIQTILIQSLAEKNIWKYCNQNNVDVRTYGRTTNE